jgi:hypothetical protein
MKFGRAISLIDKDKLGDTMFIDDLVAMLMNEHYTVPGWMSNMTKTVRVREVDGRWISGFGNEQFGAIGDAREEEPEDDSNPFASLMKAYRKVHLR